MDTDEYSVSILLEVLRDGTLKAKEHILTVLRMVRPPRLAIKYVAPHPSDERCAPAILPLLK